MNIGHLEKLPLENFHPITLSLDVYDLYHLLVVFPTRGLYHQLRRVLSNQGCLMALLYALGSLDLIQLIPNVSQLTRRFDDYARYAEQSDENAFFGGHDSMAQKFAKKIDYRDQRKINQPRRQHYLIYSTDWRPGRCPRRISSSCPIIRCDV